MNSGLLFNLSSSFVGFEVIAASSHPMTRAIHRKKNKGIHHFHGYLLHWVFLTGNYTVAMASLLFKKNIGIKNDAGIPWLAVMNNCRNAGTSITASGGTDPEIRNWHFTTVR